MLMKLWLKKINGKTPISEITTKSSKYIGLTTNIVSSGENKGNVELSLNEKFYISYTNTPDIINLTEIYNSSSFNTNLITSITNRDGDYGEPIFKMLFLKCNFRSSFI